MTYAYPLQKAATLPSSFMFEHIPGLTPPAGGEALKLLDRTPEKNYFLSVFAAKELARTGNTELSQFIQSCHEIAYFELSHHYHSVRAEYVKRPGFRTAEHVAAAMEQIQRFLDDNPEFYAEEDVLLDTIHELYALEEDLLCAELDLCLHRDRRCRS